MDQTERVLGGSEPMNNHEGSNVLIVENLMKQYGAEITNLAFTYVHDWGRAEEIAMDVFFKCYRKMDTFRGESSIKTWLYRIAINRCKDLLRTRSFRNAQPASHFASFMKKSTTSAEDEVLHKSEQKQLVNAVLSLPAKYREVIILYYYSDININDISDTIKKNPKTVRTRLRRARLMLEQMLKEGIEDGR